MSTTALRVLAQAASRIGYYAPDDPQPGSEAGRYLAAKLGQPWLAGPSTSVWWCMAFVSMCLDLEGQAASIGGLSYNTDTTLGNVRAGKGGTLVSIADAQPGDVVIFDWDGGGTDHVGFVERNLGGGVLQTIEGNTSSGAAGSQYAGNGVWRRWRSQGIAAIIRPAYNGASASALVAKAVDGQELLDVDGIAGERTIARWQQVMNTPIDGEITEPSQLIEAVQHWLNRVVPGPVLSSLTGASALDEDGYEGPKTVKALQWWLWHNVPGLAGGCTVWERFAEGGNNVALSDWCDGIRGEATNAVLQEALNRSHFYAGALMKG